MNTIKIIDDGKIKTSEIIELMKSKFPVWLYYDDERLDKDFPAPKKPTTRYFLDSVEPDPDTLGLSVNETLKKGIKQEDGITLRERLLMEIDYFDRTGQHLDVKGATFCSGSRCSGGHVPSVGLDSDGKVGVYWCYLDNSFSKNGVRVQFPLESYTLNTSLENAIQIVKDAGYKIIKEI